MSFILVVLRCNRPVTVLTPDPPQSCPTRLIPTSFWTTGWRWTRGYSWEGWFTLRTRSPHPSRSGPENGHRPSPSEGTRSGPCLLDSFDIVPERTPSPHDSVLGVQTTRVDSIPTMEVRTEGRDGLGGHGSPGGAFHLHLGDLR